MSRLPVSVMTKDSFAGGMRFDVNPNSAPDNSVRFVNNMLPAPDHALTSRDGRQRRQDTAVGDIVYNVFRWLRSDGNYRDVIAYKSSSNMVYGSLDGTGAPNNTVAGLTDGSPVIGMQTRKKMFLSNGADETRVYVFDSTEQNRTPGLGVGPTPSVALGGAGNPTSTYTYKITVLYGEDGESNPGTASASINPTNQIIDVTWSAPTPPIGMSITGYRIWRENTVSGSPYKLVGQSTASPFADDELDATVEAAGNETLHDNHNAPPINITGMRWWDYENRAVCWGENAQVGSNVHSTRLFLGELGNPEIFKTLDSTQGATNTAEFIDVPQGDTNNHIISVFAIDQNLYVFNLKGVRLIIPTGDATIPYRVVQVANSDDHGIISPNAVASTDSGEVYYVSTDGLRLIRGNVEFEIAPNSDTGANSLVTKGGPSAFGQSVASIIRGIPVSLRNQVHCHEFDDRLHISLGTDAIDGIPPTRNKDLLIYDTLRKQFVYSKDRGVYGMTTVNDSGNSYRMITAGYTVDSSSSDATKGNVWNEYVPGVEVDEDADGNTSSYPWESHDYERPLASFDLATLDDFILDAGSSTGVITVEINLDGGDQTFSNQFTYTSTGQRAWFGEAYWQSDASTASITPAQVTTRVAAFAAISDGSFRVVVDGVNKDTSSIDTSSDTTIEEVTATINAAIVTAGHDALFDIVFIRAEGLFRIRHEVVGSTKTVTGVTTTGAGTNLATALLLGTGASEISFVPDDVPSGFTGMFWWGPAVSTPTDDKYKWSGSSSSRKRPKRKAIFGPRGALACVRVSGTAKATLYGYRMRSFVTPNMSD